MDTDTIIRQLEYEADKHKNDRLFTGQTDITAMCRDLIPKMKELKRYEDLEQVGRLPEFPCKVGQLLFCFSRGEIYTFKVRCIRTYEERMEIELWYSGEEDNLSFWHINISSQDIGYKFFLTEEAAEAAMKEMEGQA